MIERSLTCCSIVACTFSVAPIACLANSLKFMKSEKNVTIKNFENLI